MTNPSTHYSLSEFLNPVFVETGTFHGAGVRTALETGFKSVVSFEIHEPLVKENLETFQTEIAQGIVEIIQGDTADCLSDVIEHISDPVTFWLDAHAHIQNGGGKGRNTCPVIDELKQIKEARNGQADIILIDDLRMMEDRRMGWNVNLGDLYSLLWEIRKDFVIFRVDGCVPHDILACVPKSYRPVSTITK